MAFDLVGDNGDSVGTISKSNSIRRHAKSRKHYTFLSFCCIFHLSIWFASVVMGVGHVIPSGLLKCNDVFFGKINIH